MRLSSRDTSPLQQRLPHSGCSSSPAPSPTLVPGSPRSHAECCIRPLEARHPRALLCTGFEYRGKSKEPRRTSQPLLQEEDRESRGEAGECGGLRNPEARSQSSSLPAGVGREEGSIEALAHAHGWGMETEANSPFNWTVGPESQAFKYHLALCFKTIFFKLCSSWFK